MSMPSKGRLEKAVAAGGLAGLIAAAVLAFAGKADADDVNKLQRDFAVEVERNVWRDAALCGIARRLAVDVPPNPNCK